MAGIRQLGGHTIGPDYTAGERDRSLLVSCYRRALEVADELGARSVASPLISAGVYGWPRDDAMDVAVETIHHAETDVDQVVAVDAAVTAGLRTRVEWLGGPRR